MDRRSCRTNDKTTGEKREVAVINDGTFISRSFQSNEDDLPLLSAHILRPNVWRKTDGRRGQRGHSMDGSAMGGIWYLEYIGIPLSTIGGIWYIWTSFLDHRWYPVYLVSEIYRYKSVNHRRYLKFGIWHI